MIGKQVKFTSGRNSTEFVATVFADDGKWLSTKDEAGKVRKTLKARAVVVG